MTVWMVEFVRFGRNDNKGEISYIKVKKAVRGKFSAHGF